MVEIAWWWKDFVFAWWILFPAYAANMFPPLAKGKRPIDFGKTFFGKRVLGNGKTFEGFAIGLLAGFLIGALETATYPALNEYALSWGVSMPEMNLFIGFMIALGALCGDLMGSFLKRRMGKIEGESVILLDQLDFILGATAFAYVFTRITPGMVFFMLVVTPIIHRITCIVGYKLGLKRVPW